MPGFSCGLDHACLVSLSGEVTCWGDDSYGQIDVPAYVAASPQVAVAAGMYHTCALGVGSSNFSVSCWGLGVYGQTSPPDDVLNAPQAALAAGQFHTCAVSGVDGSVLCWGTDGGTGRLSVPAGGAESSCNSAVSGVHRGTAARRTVPSPFRERVREREKPPTRHRPHRYATL